MPAPTAPFAPDQLDLHANLDHAGHLKKTPVHLLKCPLKEMDQFNCWLKGDQINCERITRLFRQCADGMTVETTAWKGETGR